MAEPDIPFAGAFSLTLWILVFIGLVGVIGELMGLFSLFRAKLRVVSVDG